MMPYETPSWVNIGSGNGLFPDGTQPFPLQTNIDLPAKAFVALTWE